MSAPFQVTIYTDGSCLKDPVVGGYASILVCNGHEKLIEGAEVETTNNRMELTAVIEALKALNKPCDVTVYSDSQYVVHTITKSWKRNKNQDLWAAYDRVAKSDNIASIHFQWVKGHDGNPFNERCDKRARLIALARAQEKAMLMLAST